MCSALVLEKKMSQYNSNSSSSSDYSDDDEVVCVKKRATKAPSKLKDFVQEKESVQKREVLLKCCQTGSKIKSKLEDISHTNDMAPIEVKDLRKGFCVMVEVDGKPYPAEFLEFIDTSKQTKLKRAKKHSTLEAAKRELQSKSDRPPKRRKMDDIGKSNEKSSSVRGGFTSSSPPIDQGDAGCSSIASPVQQMRNDESATTSPFRRRVERDMLVIMDKKLDTILARIAQFEEKFAEVENITPSASKSTNEPDGNNDYKVNGIDIRCVHATSALAYGRILLDMLFERKVLQQSVLLTSQRSDRPALDSAKVKLLFKCVRQRFPDMNERELIRNLNQKCRDSCKFGKLSE